jgi:hypothetical protein
MMKRRPKQHSHWPHTILCIVMCLTLHFTLEWIRDVHAAQAARKQDDNISAYIADLQEQIDLLNKQVIVLEAKCGK